MITERLKKALCEYESASWRAGNWNNVDDKDTDKALEEVKKSVIECIQIASEEAKNAAIGPLAADVAEIKSMLAHLINALAEDHGEGDERAVTDLDGYVVTLSGVANGSLDDA